MGGFLVFLAAFYSRSDTWVEIFSGFFKIGNIPVVALQDLNGDGVLDAADSLRGNNVDNVFVSLAQGRGFPKIDLTWIGFLTAMIAISGNGGLTNTPISTFTREQGWGWESMWEEFRASLAASRSSYHTWVWYSQSMPIR